VRKGVGYHTFVTDMPLEFVISQYQRVSGVRLKFHNCFCPQISWEGSEQHFNLSLLSLGSLVNHGVADVIIGETIPAFKEIFPQSSWSLQSDLKHDLIYM